MSDGFLVIAVHCLDFGSSRTDSRYESIGDPMKVDQDFVQTFQTDNEIMLKVHYRNTDLQNLQVKAGNNVASHILFSDPCDRMKIQRSVRASTTINSLSRNENMSQRG